MNDIVDDSYQWSEPRDSKAPDLKPYADLAKALAERDLAYRQLMEKAVRFARILEQIANAHGFTGIETQQFLNSPEAQASMKEHNRDSVIDLLRNEHAWVRRMVNKDAEYINSNNVFKK